jgi:flagellar biosynthetic protein FliQ
MIEAELIQYARNALILVIFLSAPAVFASLFVGLTISLFQATTQIQDQALTFVPKLIAVIMVLILTGEWASRQAKDFCESLFVTFPNLIQ